MALYSRGFDDPTSILLYGQLIAIIVTLFTVQRSNASSISHQTRAIRNNASPWNIRAHIKCFGRIGEDWETLDLVDATDGVDGAGSSGSGRPLQTLRYDRPLKLCAARRYGGKAQWNARGSCAWQINPPEVVFEPQDEQATTMIDAAEDEILHFCALRCRCLANAPRLEDNRSTREVATQEIQWADLTRFQTFSGHLDINPPLRYIPSTFDASILRLILLEGPSRTGLLEGNNEEADGNIEPLFTPRTIEWDDHLYSEIKCYGSVPPWTLPTPFDRSPGHRDNPSTAQELCAADFHHGWQKGNAGFMCLRRSPASTFDILHQEDYLAHPSLVYGNTRAILDGATLGSLAVEAWCKRACRCDHGRADNEAVKLPNVITLRKGDSIILGANFHQNIVMFRTYNARLRTDKTVGYVSVDEPSGGYTANAAAEISSIGSTDSLTATDRCGVPCQKQSDCVASTDDGKGCGTCVAWPSKQAIVASGLDPLGVPRGLAMCLSLARVAMDSQRYKWP